MSLPAYALPGDPAQSPFWIEVAEGGGEESARIVFGPRRILLGLLAHLPAELLPVLLTLLALVNRSGEVRATAAQIASLLGIHPDEAEARLVRLVAFPSPQQSLAFFREADSSYGLSRQYFPIGYLATSLALAEDDTYRPAPREDVIAHSRAQYGTPLAEAERAVEAQLGIRPLPGGPEGKALQGLINAGVQLETARELITDFPLTRITEQLHWLSHRAARQPARYLVAAIRGDFAPPSTLPVHIKEQEGDV